METTLKSQQSMMHSTVHAVNQMTSKVSDSAYDKFIEKLQFSYFGIISMTILVGSILGGIASMFIFQNDAPIWQAGLVMAIAMANNVAAIGQAPLKWVVNIFILCTLACTFFILINL